ncbi:CbiX/SirB N-terminal domain-containing protein [soil metagenome]
MTSPALLALHPARRTARPTLLAVAHGSRDPRAECALADLVDGVRTLDVELDVRLSYIDHSEPSLSAALQAQREAVVVPLLLAAAAHSKGDIPGALQAARMANPLSRLTYGRVLGPHPLLLDALEQRLAKAGVPPEAAVVLAGSGSADPEANADLAQVGRLLWEHRRGGPVEVAYASATHPGVAEAIERLRRLGHEDVAVAAYFLAPGRLLDRVHADAAGCAVTESLAGTEAVVRLVVERYAEALAGAAAMNCDCCVYRSAWPGHEQRVGAPQRSHTHPADQR